MRLIRILFLCALLLFLFATVSKAQDKDPLSELSLEQLLSTPITTATMAVKPLREAPSTVYVITEKMIRERSYLYLQDALRDAPGIDIIWMGGLYGPILMQRGMDTPENNKFLLMIDGIVDNNLSAGTAQIYMQYSLQNVKRIEILFGPASALYGANAMTGLINIITKKGSDLQGFHVSGSGVVWDPGFRRAGGSADFAAGRQWGEETQMIEASGSFHIVGTHGTDLRLSDEARSDLPKNPGGANYYFSPKHIGSGELGTFLAQGRLSVQEFGLILGGYVWEHRGGQGTFGHEGFAFLNGFQNKPDSWNFRNSTAFITYDRKIGEAKNTFSFVFRDTRILNDSYDAYFSVPGTGPDGAGLPGDAGVRYFRPDHSLKFEDNVNWELASNMEVTAGASAELQYVSDYQLSTGHSFDQQELLDPGATPVVDESRRYDYDDYSAYVEHRWQLTSDFSLTSGLRMDVFRLHGDSTPSFFGTKDHDANGNCVPNAPDCKTAEEAAEAGAVEISNVYYLNAPFRRTQTTWNPRIGAVYSPEQKPFTLKVLYGEGFRMPTVREHFSVTNSRFSNPFLQSEKIRTAEVSATYAISGNSFLELDTFLTYALDIAQLAPSSVKRPGRTTFLNQFQNIGKARIYGFDLKIQTELVDGIELFGNYSYQIPRYLEADPRALSHETETSDVQDSSNRIPRQAKHKGTLGATLSFWERRFILTPRVNFVGDRPSVITSPIQEIPAYGSLNFSALIKDIGWKGVYGQFAGYNLTHGDILDPGFRTANKLDDFPAAHPQPGFHFYVNLGYERRF